MTPSRPPGGTSERWILERLLPGIIIAWIAARAIPQMKIGGPITVDDAWITLRYARHWAEGLGIVWNPGEPPVEGYSNFLFVALAAGAFRLGWDAPMVLDGVNGLGLAGTCWIMSRWASHWVHPTVAWIAAFVLTSYDGTVYWTVSGLETATYQFLVVLSGYAFLRGAGFQPGTPHGASAVHPPRVAWMGAAGGAIALASMTRPEGPLLEAACFLSAVVRIGWPRSGETTASVAARWAEWKRPLGVHMAAFTVPYGIYFAWRGLHFGRWLPHPLYCKSAFDFSPFVLHADFLKRSAWWLILAAIPLWQDRLDPRHLLPWLFLGLVALALMGVDPVVAFQSRYFLPAWALLLPLSVAGGSALAARLPGRAAMAAPVIVWLLVAGPTWGWSARSERLIAADRKEDAGRRAAYLELADWMNGRLKEGDRYLIGEAGFIPYHTRARAVDCLCLNNPAMTRPPLDYSIPAFVDSIYADPPALMILPSRHPVRLIPYQGLWGDVYPRLLEHPDFRRTWRFVRAFGAKGDIMTMFVFERRAPARAILSMPDGEQP